MKISPFAGQYPHKEMLIDVPKLINSYYTNTPDISIPSQKVEFGTSGHRGSSLENSFNENHILAITQAICLYRAAQKIEGPLFLGIDTHALSQPAMKTALEVLAANHVQVLLSENDEFTPTPAISHAILTYNKNKKSNLADGIVITPSHNPPAEGGFKYNPPNGGPAEPSATNWIQDKANEFLKNNLEGIKRIPYEEALKASTTKRHNFMKSYVDDLANVIDMDAIKNANINIGVAPLGGAGVHYWKAIATKYGINLTILDEKIDPTFQFMTIDWDGKIRMDPSSPYAMKSLIGLKDSFDIAFACDTDYDRHGIVTKSSGLLAPNHFLAASVYYLFQHRPLWGKNPAVGKTLVSSQMIDLITEKLNRKLYEVPVGFKWFVEGLFNGSLGFTGEESAGASFLRKDGTVWTTDKDGIILCLLAAEMTAKLGKDPGTIYSELTEEFGNPLYDRVEALATPAQKKILKNLSESNIRTTELAGEKILAIMTKAPGNNAPIGGVKVVSKHGWFAARPSGTEDIYKIYAESFLGRDHLALIIEEAQSIVNEALKAADEEAKLSI